MKYDGFTWYYNKQLADVNTFSAYITIKTITKSGDTDVLQKTISESFSKMSEIEQKSKSQNLDALNKVPCPFDEVSLLDFYAMIIRNFGSGSKFS